MTPRKTIPAPKKKALPAVKGNKANIYDVIEFENQLYRVSQNIQQLRDNIRIAESILAPQRYQLYQTYIDSCEDSHLTGVMNSFYDLVLSREINFYNKDGEINIEVSKLLKTKWFTDFCTYALQSKSWGFSCIQLGDRIDTGFTYVELIPRIYVKPEFHLVTDTYSSFTGDNYLEEPWNKWVVGVGDDKDLGLLKQASYHAIWKKTALGAWASFAQKFGLPAIIYYTNTNNAEIMKSADNMMKRWSTGQSITLPKADKVEFIEAKQTDAFQVFKSLVEMCNSEMTKLYLEQTGTTDEKAFAGSASVHNEGLQRVKHRLTFFLENVINQQLKPVLEWHGFPVGDVVCRITDNEDVEVSDRIAIDKSLIASASYKLSPEYLKEKYGTDVEAVEVDASVEKPVKTKDKSIKNALHELYK